MGDRAWKRAEREVAALLGGRRVPVAGRRGNPDVAHERFAVEVKQRRSLPRWLARAMEQARAAHRDGQVPVVVLHSHGEPYRRALVVMELGDLIAFGQQRRSP